MKKTIEKKQNKSGKWFALCESEGRFWVYAKHENYSRGKIVSSWRYCVPNPRLPYLETSRIGWEGMEYPEAKSLFDKKIAGKENESD